MTVKDPIDTQADQQYLTFSLGEEDYGIDVLRVQEIRGWEKPREIPNTPDYLKGVWNLRGRIVPIIDMRLRFNLASAAYSGETVVIVLSVFHQDTELIMGVVVDQVSDMLSVNDSQVNPPPELGQHIDTRFLNGMISTDDRMVVLIAVDSILDPNEFRLMEGMKQSDGHDGGGSA